MPRQIKKQERKTLVWLLSFTDVVALMLTFFVMLFSMSNPKEDSWSKVVTALGSEFNTQYGARQDAGIHANDEINRLQMNRGLDLGYLAALLHRVLEQNQALDQVNIVKYPDRVLISLPNDLLFNSGRAELKDGGKKAVFALAQSLRYIKNRIEVEGHTDPDPIRGGDYPSNWGLSLARAASVAGVLRATGYEREIIVQGFADKEYETLPVTMEKEMRYDISRRVDIVVLRFEDQGVFGF